MHALPAPDGGRSFSQIMETSEKSRLDRTAISKTFRVTIVIPCYNEARRLQIPRFRDFLAANHSKHILFVDDGSRDDTVKLLEQICCGFDDRAGILQFDRNKGKAEAVRWGINHALNTFQQDIIGYWDADLATPLDSVGRFLAVLDDHPRIEMVFGSRIKLLGRRVERRATRHYLGRIFATVVSVMLRLPIYDTQCGAKLFRVDENLRRVFAHPFLSKWVFDVEIIARYLQLYRDDSRRLEEGIYEYPLEVWIDIEGSKVRAKDFFRAFVDVLRIKRKYL
jgi:dolichyl-phosphate beta-glucosyltransferase